MREQGSKDETDSFMKLATDIMLTRISEKSGIKIFGEKAVAAMVKEYRYIDKGPMEGNQIFTPIDTETLSYDEKGIH